MQKRRRRRKINYHKLLELVVFMLFTVAFGYYLVNYAQPDKEEAERAYYHSAEYGAMMRRQQLKQIADEKERQEIAAQYHAQEKAKKEAWLLECERKYDAQREAERQNFIQHRRDPRGVISVAE